ncbi:MAG: flagellar basal body L-ring protein FlgH [Alphaproteobacteria bacterium]|nr:flagellar basal body L-ring protein FlgH [Alphaproteobacteria bacterium]
MTIAKAPWPLILASMLMLAGCDTMDSIQKAPNFSAPGTVTNIPRTSRTSEPIEAANMEAPPPAARGALWRSGSKTFFRDPRARSVGDLLTVAVNLQEQAEFNHQTNLSRSNSDSMSFPSFFGLSTLIKKAISGSDPSVNVTSAIATAGQGDIKHTDSVTVNVAATVVACLPNGNLEIVGSQEIRLSNELRELQLRGIVRPEDIHSDNTIPSEKIADARIEYGGRGAASVMERAPWGQDLLNRVQPF